MWNHSQNFTPEDADLDVNSNLKEKIEKSLDLTIYLKYLQNLFSQSTSDSESSDGEDQLLQNQLQLSQSQIQNPIEIQNQNHFLSSVAAASESSSNSSSESSTNSSLHFSSSSSTSGSASSSDSTSSSTSGDENDTLANEMTPMSDEELKNLMRAHKMWKKTPFHMGSQVDIASLVSANQSSDQERRQKRHRKKSKRPSTHQKKSRVIGNVLVTSSSKNHSSSGFRGGGISNLLGGCANACSSSSKLSKSRPRKQSLKNVRSEETIAAASKASGCASLLLTASKIAKASLAEVKMEIDGTPPQDDMDSAIGLATSAAPSASASMSDCIGEGFNFSAEEDEDEDQNTTNPGSVSLNIGSIVDDDDDDNDSLSDYMSMAATAAASTSQVPPISQPQGFLKFKTAADTSVFPAGKTSADFKISAVAAVTTVSAGGTLIGSGHSHGIEHRKRKGDSKDKGDSPKQKKISAQKQAKMIEILNMKRRRIYVLLCKKEIGKTQRSRTNNHKEMLVVKRRLAQACTRHLRQKAIQSQKAMKESVWRAKRLTREMQAYWKQTDRVEREVRKRREKEAEEQRKQDVELMEAKRQQRKLNFLITQTELYAHFMSKKLGGADGEDETRILNQLNEEKNARLARIDDYDSEVMKNKAKANVETAFVTQISQVRLFDMDSKVREDFKNDLRIEAEGNMTGEFAQPKMFDGVLKHYQLKGMNWLVNLYDQGINGILADEMGLGKTVQSIAFLAHVAEYYGVWGPFLIIAPASTLHNWQQEFKRFVSDFKVVPYWGNPQERKILRQFWQQSNLHTEEASFHVVVTSYQIVVADLKYFNRIKWQYLILDEAQAIKSTASARWKMLLGFSCRNRLLLTGTPIQNTMGELWALLHFIMPSLFDSHEEFNEWFSKDIESHAENKTFIDEKHLSRLHLILKPFMLRRIKKDVENELSDKIEVLVYCPLTARQRLLYTVLKKKIRIEDLLKSAGPSNSQLAQHATTNLMNLVMQFRKVCNHPDLFERREVKSPFHIKRVASHYPKLLFRDGLLHFALPSRLHLLENKFSIFNPVNIHQSLLGLSNRHVIKKGKRIVKIEDLNVDISLESEWSFIRFIRMSPSDLNKLVYGGLLSKWMNLVAMKNVERLEYQRHSISEYDNEKCFLSNTSFIIQPHSVISWPNVSSSLILQDFVFTSYASIIYTLSDHKIFTVPETFEHRLLRSRKIFPDLEEPPLLPEVTHVSKDPSIRPLQLTAMPSFLHYLCPAVSSGGHEVHFHDRSAAWWLLEHELCSTPNGLKCVLFGSSEKSDVSHFTPVVNGGLKAIQPDHGWSQLVIPDREKLVTDSGKLAVLDTLLKRLKAHGHRVLIYSQMTRMIDLLEEYMWYRKWTYMRLDGSSKIAERRDMVADFQSRSDIFVFLLSTRAGGLGINLTAADTVIFYDSDWNPTVDQQAMDRAHRLGQTKQVTVYRLICKGTIEERILQRAREKNEIQRMVISGGNFRPDTLKPKEVVSLLLDDEELERKYRQKQAERKLVEDPKLTEVSKEIKSSPPASTSKRKLTSKSPNSSEKSSQEREKLPSGKKLRIEDTGSMVPLTDFESCLTSSVAGSIEGSNPGSPAQSDDLGSGEAELEADLLDAEESSNEGSYIELSPSSISCLEGGSKTIEWNTDSISDFDDDLTVLPKRPKVGRGTGKRGRPPSRVRVQIRETDGETPIRRGPGRPRLRPIGPANQGIRGRRPGRPPLSKKAENPSSTLTPLTTSQRVFGFYSSPDVP